MPRSAAIRRGFVDGPHGQMFYREAGSGHAVVLVHQILRTSLDYRFVMPLLAERYRVIAFDIAGCGDSDAPPRPYSIEDHAAAVATAMDNMGLRDAAIVGHHSGANIALELCVQRPDLARSTALSGLFYVNDREQLEELYAKALKLQDPEPRPDGSHLLALWQEGLWTNWGKPRLPAERLDLLGDFFLEQVKTGPRRFEPYVAQMKYDTAARLPLLGKPCLFISASDDVFMCSATDLWRRDQPAGLFVRIEVHGGGEMPRLYPAEWAAAIIHFLADDEYPAFPPAAGQSQAHAVRIGGEWHPVGALPKIAPGPGKSE